MKVGDRVRIKDSPWLMGEILKVYDSGNCRIWLDGFRELGSDLCWIIAISDLEILPKTDA